MALAPPTATLPGRPYPGIEPFRYADQAIFFARAPDVNRLLRYVTMYRAVLLYGDSGCGKSSLVNAGFCPLALAEGYLPERIRVQPRQGEEICIERTATADDERAAYLPSIFAPDEHGPLRVVLSLEEFRARIVRSTGEQTPVLIFDQLEELVTLFEQRAAGSSLADLKAVQGAIVQTIVGLINESLLPVKLLFVFREDYLAKLLRLFASCPDLRDQYVRLLPPQLEDLHTIIRGPFESWPGAFGHELSPSLAADLERAIRNDADQETLNLSAVQIACLKLWEAPDPETLFREKGIQGLLGDYVADTLDDFPAGQRDLAVALLSHMVTPSGTRNVVSQDDLVRQVRTEEQVGAERVLDTLQALETQAKLIRREGRHDVQVYEIVSEFLVPGIARQKEERHVRLARAAAEIEAHWQLEASRAAAERRRRRYEVSIDALVVLLVIFGALAWWALDRTAAAEQALLKATEQQNRAEQAQADAEQAGRVAEAQRTLAELAQLSAEQGRTAAERAQSESDRQRALAEQALNEATQQRTRAERAEDVLLVVSPYVASTIVRGHDGAVYAAVFDPSGQRIATASEDGTVRIWDAASADEEQVLTGHAGRVYAVAFSPDGQHLASAGEDSTTRVWDLATGDATILREHTDRVVGVAFSPDGQQLVSASADRTARVWNLESGASRVLSGHTDLVTSAAFDPAGRRVVTTSDDRTARIWDLESGDPPAILRGHTREVTGAAFSPDGSLVVTSSADKTALVWNLASAEPLAVLSGHQDRVISAVFSPNGRFIATASADDTARVWDWSTQTVQADLRGHGDRVYSAVFSPDGDRIVTASRDRSARIWTRRSTSQPDATPRISPVVTTKFDDAPSPTGSPLQEGLAALSQGNLSLAISRCSAAIDASPNDAQAYFCRGLGYDRTDTDTGARQAVLDYGEAIRLDPSLSIAYLERGLLLANVLDDCGQARLDLQRYLDLQVEGPSSTYEALAQRTLEKCS